MARRSTVKFRRLAESGIARSVRRYKATASISNPPHLAPLANDGSALTGNISAGLAAGPRSAWEEGNREWKEEKR